MPHRLRLPRAVPLFLAAVAILPAAGSVSAANGRQVDRQGATSPAAAGEEGEWVEEEVEWEWTEAEEREEVEAGEAEAFETAEATASDAEGGWEVTFSRPPRARCVRDVTARVSASSSRDTVRLAIGYLPSASGRITIHTRLQSGRAMLPLRPLRRPLRGGGTAKASLRLSEPEMAMVWAAPVLLVHIEVSGGSEGCEQHRVRRLTARQRSAGRTTWSERLRRPDSR
jgi:hypothetical protein